MDSQDLQRLLLQNEGPTLEFKQEWYRLDDPNQDTKKRQRGELVKDILSLANGNASTAGETAYLIIGVSDKLNESGERDIFGIGDLDITVERIRQLVKTSCEPQFENILGEIVEANGKRVLVITIPPSLHLYETIRRLDTCSEHTFTEHVVFIRSNGNVEIASFRDRVAISKMKESHFNKTRNAPPTRFGAAIGAITCGWTAANLTNERTNNKGAAIGAGIGGVLVGGLLGGAIGRMYTNLIELRSDWHKLSTPWRMAYIVIPPSLGIIISKLVSPKRRPQS